LINEHKFTDVFSSLCDLRSACWHHWERWYFCIAWKHEL